MEITLWGTSRITYRILKGLLKLSDIKVSLLITTNIKTTYPKLKKLCAKYNIPVADTPSKVSGVNVIAAYGKYITEEFFGNPEAIFINVHPSLLPKYRGANPIVGALLDGNTKTGVTFHRTVKGLDEGEIFDQLEVPIDSTETAYSLEKKLAKVTYENLPTLIKNLDNIKPYPQKGTPTYADRSLVDFQSAHVDWTLSSEAIKWHIQAYFDNPIAWSKLSDKILKIYPGELVPADFDYPLGTIILTKTAPFVQIAVTNGLYIPAKLQLESKAVVDPKGFVNGYERFNLEVLR